MEPRILTADEAKWGGGQEGGGVMAQKRHAACRVGGEDLALALE